MLGDWILINTETDASESKDYSSSHPKIKQELIEIYNKDEGKAAH